MGDGGRRRPPRRRRRGRRGSYELAWSAALTRSARRGSVRTRTPVASKRALAMAGATTLTLASPTPVGGISGWSISTACTLGASAMVKMGYFDQSTLVTLLPSKVTSVDWSKYPILTMADAPRVQAVLIDHPEIPPTGVGEASVNVVAPAIA